MCDIVGIGLITFWSVVQFVILPYYKASVEDDIEIWERVSPTSCALNFPSMFNPPIPSRTIDIDPFTPTPTFTDFAPDPTPSLVGVFLLVLGLMTLTLTLALVDWCYLSEQISSSSPSEPEPTEKYLGGSIYMQCLSERLQRVLANQNSSLAPSESEPAEKYLGGSIYMQCLSERLQNVLAGQNLKPTKMGDLVIWLAQYLPTSSVAIFTDLGLERPSALPSLLELARQGLGEEAMALQYRFMEALKADMKHLDALQHTRSSLNDGMSLAALMTKHCAAELSSSLDSVQEEAAQVELPPEIKMRGCRGGKGKSRAAAASAAAAASTSAPAAPPAASFMPVPEAAPLPPAPSRVEPLPQHPRGRANTRGRSRGYRGGRGGGRGGRGDFPWGGGRGR